MSDREPKEPIAAVPFDQLLHDVRACRLCEASLPRGPRPLLQASPEARLLIVGQAPGRRAHEAGAPFHDPSGDRLRTWLGLSEDVFYDSSRVAILPMGFCYPGTGKSGDLAPRPECQEAWRKKLLSQLPAIKLTVLLGRFAHKSYGLGVHESLTDTVRSWRTFAPALFPLPHPSPRNNRWLKQNPWFLDDLLPELAAAVKRSIR